MFKGELEVQVEPKYLKLVRIMGNRGGTVPEGFGGHVSSRDAVIDERFIPHWIQRVL